MKYNKRKKKGRKMKFYNYLKEKIYEWKTIEYTFEKWSAIITTMENKQIKIIFKWIRTDDSLYNVPNFHMMGRKYFTYDNVMYPIENIVKIEWKKEGSYIKRIPYKFCDFKITYTDEELGIGE